MRTAFRLCVLLVLPALAALPAVAQQGKRFGALDAPITVEVFSDMQCPACATYHLETLRPLMKDYVATGKVFLIFRLTVNHRHSYRAARYMNAAALAGLFEKASEVLFEKQKLWSETGDVEAALAAGLTEVEMARIREQLDAQEIEQAIEADRALARTFQVRSTPTTFIRHRGETTPVVGVVSYAILRRYLDRLLEGSP
ncbi:MAG: DsbA family protein [Acidobacteriia bacterium]|jgi:protein-disulfide isomerase|nr:DsbA family protein [Terriglobia bacterium]